MSQPPLRVLVLVDGSAASRRAIEHVLDLAARGVPMEVHLLNVQPAVRGVAASLVSHEDLDRYHREEGMKTVREAAGPIEAAGLKPQIHVGVGDAGETAVAFARKLGCEQIVMGTRGHGAVRGLLLGSVARHVLSEANMPVTLVR